MDYKIHQIFFNLQKECMEDAFLMKKHLLEGKIAIPQKFIQKAKETINKEIKILKENPTLEKNDWKGINNHVEKLYTTLIVPVVASSININKKNILIDEIDFTFFNHFTCFEKIAEAPSQISFEEKISIAHSIIEKTQNNQMAIAQLAKLFFKNGRGDLLYDLFNNKQGIIQIIPTPDDVWHNHLVDLYQAFVQKSEVNILTSKNDNFLFLSIRKNNFEAAKKLIDLGADLGIKNKFNQGVLRINLKSKLCQKIEPSAILDLEHYALKHMQTNQTKNKAKFL